MSSVNEEVVAGAGAEWFFFHGGPGAPRYGGDPTKHAVDHDTETFVREVLQNANDQGIDDETVEVTFRFVDLEGDALKEFLKALGWGEGLHPRLQSVVESGRGDQYAELLERLDDPEDEEPSLRLLVVEDRNTTGLTGGWGEDSNYAALVRDELYSNKRGENAGGSYGVGKSVLWTFSGASTVVFNSNPIGDTIEHPQTTRLIGRAKLPTHTFGDGDQDYQGAGWLCVPEETETGVRPSSVRGREARALAERLHVDRPRVSGTSVLIAGFRDPTRDAEPTLETLSDEFVEAAIKYFWPAMYRGDLRVTVETSSGTTRADLGEAETIRPFVECYADRYADNEELEAPGDVAGYDFPIEIPRRTDGSPTSDGSVRLAARLTGPTDDETLVNHVALFRGSGMVVKYLDQRRVAFGDRNFHAVLAAGSARAEGAPDLGDREVDRFLRFAEPPTHDEWHSTENLREQYKYGFRSALERMFDDVREGLRNLVSRPLHGGTGRIDRLGDKFPVHGEGRRMRLGNGSEEAFSLDASTRFDDGRWVVDGTVEPLVEHTGWRSEVSLVTLGEDGRADRRVELESLSTDSDSVDTEFTDESAALVASESTGVVTFEGRSVSLGIDDADLVGETRLELEATIAVEDES
ncbi:hypothetical protein [Halomarina rubra]|uniref:Uncharacterized protein n=1 Tax=Halomarina rubra TaxID=2071873 RepID=A0ABD6AX74_9EURY|nr:hypothetical protein [Halomarina rubra]